MISHKEKIIKILKPYLEDEFFNSDLDNSYALRGMMRKRQCNILSYSKVFEKGATRSVSLYRAVPRVIKNKSEIYHVPLNFNNGYQGRFSSRTNKTLYLGVTSMICHMEIGSPENNWSISGYKPNDEGKKLRVMNLICPQHLINGVDDFCLQVSLLKIYPLIIATSIKVKNKKTDKNSEYRLSQLIMECLKDMKIDGVVYLSAQGMNDLQFPYGVSISFPVMDRSSKYENYGSIIEKFDITEPLIVDEEFDDKTIGEKTSYINDIYYSKSAEYIYNGSYKVTLKDGLKKDYHDLIYSRIDNYLENSYSSKVAIKDKTI